MSIRACVLGSGSRGNSTLVATERTRLLIDAGLSRKETYARLAAVGDIEITPFSIPHDAVDPVAFTFEAEGLKIGLVTDLGYVPEIVKQRVRGCHCLILESNHDVEMLKIGPYPWHVKQRVMGRQGHLSNRATGDFLTGDYDGEAQVLVLAHLSENNNHPEIARLNAQEALGVRSAGRGRPELFLASQCAPTKVFQF